MLVVRGVGIGCDDDAGDGRRVRDARRARPMPRATSALDVLQRVGGSVGTALLAVVLQGEIKDPLAGGGGSLARVPGAPAQVAEPLAEAFAHDVLVGGRG